MEKDMLSKICSVLGFRNKNVPNVLVQKRIEYANWTFSLIFFKLIILNVLTKKTVS